MAFTAMVQLVLKGTVLNLTVQKTNSVFLPEGPIVSARMVFIATSPGYVLTQTNVRKKTIAIKVQPVQIPKEVIIASARKVFTVLAFHA